MKVTIDNEAILAICQHYPMRKNAASGIMGLPPDLKSTAVSWLHDSIRELGPAIKAYTLKHDPSGLGIVEYTLATLKQYKFVADVIQQTLNEHPESSARVVSAEQLQDFDIYSHTEISPGRYSVLNNAFYLKLTLDEINSLSELRAIKFKKVNFGALSCSASISTDGKTYSLYHPKRAAETNLSPEQLGQKLAADQTIMLSVRNLYDYFERALVQLKKQIAQAEGMVDSAQSMLPDFAHLPPPTVFTLTGEDLQFLEDKYGVDSTKLRHKQVTLHLVTYTKQVLNINSQLVNSGAVGEYAPDTRTVRIALAPTTLSIPLLESVLIHELTHFIQDILHDRISGYKEKSQMYPHQFVKSKLKGEPAVLQSELPSQSQGTPHEMRDIEYHTRLSQEITFALHGTTSITKEQALEHIDKSAWFQYLAFAAKQESTVIQQRRQETLSSENMKRIEGMRERLNALKAALKSQDKLFVWRAKQEAKELNSQLNEALHEVKLVSGFKPLFLNRYNEARKSFIAATVGNNNVRY